MRPTEDEEPYPKIREWTFPDSQLAFMTTHYHQMMPSVGFRDWAINNFLIMCYLTIHSLTSEDAHK